MLDYTIIQSALFIFAVFLLIVGYSFILSFFFKAPPVPSTLKAREAVADAIEENDINGKNIVDMGSGYGHMVFYMSKRFPNKKIIGCEISFVPWICSVLWKNIFRYKNVSFLLGNGFSRIENKEIKPSSLIFYLTPKLTKKVYKIMPLIKKLIVANNFPIKNKKENQKIKVDDWAKSTIYLYKI